MAPRSFAALRTALYSLPVPALAIFVTLGGCVDEGGVPLDERLPPEPLGRMHSATLSGDPPSGWLAMVTDRIGTDEYRIQPDPSATFATFVGTSRVANLHAMFDDLGVEVSPRAEAGRFVWHWRLSGVGRTGAMRALPPVDPALGGCDLETRVGSDGTCLRRLEYPHEGVRESYQNFPEGLEQHFDVEAAPAGEGPLVLAAEIGGGLFGRAEGDGAVFYDDGGDVLSYRELHVWDAAGLALEAWLEVDDTSIRIMVDDRDALYPIHVDPLINSTWNVDETNWGSSPDATFGRAIVSGDFDNDGDSDVAIGAPGWDNGATTDVGKVYVFMSTGIGLPTSTLKTITGLAAGDQLGRALAAGDFNDDGASDLAVGVPYRNLSNIDDGQILVYHGCATGGCSFDTATSETIINGSTGGFLGWSLSGGGRFNEIVGGSTYADLIAGEPYWDASMSDSNVGRVHAYYGSSTGLPISPSWTANGPGGVGGPHFGYSVAVAGDADGDGFDGIVVGAPWHDGVYANEGSVYVTDGSPTGLVSPMGVVEFGGQADAYFGWSVAGAGDVDGDGYADILVGAPFYDTGGPANNGRVRVLRGPSWTVNATLTGEVANDNFGHSVSSAGDVNGDGYADILVGAPYYNDGTDADAGKVYGYYGRSTGISTTVSFWRVGVLPGDLMGHAVACVGDINNDGFSDVMAGVIGYDFPGPGGSSGVGTAELYIGTPLGLSVADRTWNGDLNDAKFGHAVAGAGDVDSDGYDDVVIGAPFYTAGEASEGRIYVYHGAALGLPAIATYNRESNWVGAQFGYAVAGAGDMNRDGYDDVIVGAPFYTSGHTEEGRVYVLYGSASGLGTVVAAYTNESDLPTAHLGWSVSSAGDIDADGDTDAIAGAPTYDNGGLTDAGLARVYKGSAAGPSFYTDILGGGLGNQLGHSVGHAGDFNRDRYSDIVIGAPFADGALTDAGYIVVYGGSIAGLNLATPLFSESGPEIGGNMGYAVAGAGDFNGNGYADVVAGIPNYGGTDAGAIRIWWGTTSPTPTAVTLSVSFAGAHFGKAVASAGDVNADGFADLVVGAPNYVGAFVDVGYAAVYHGGSTFDGMPDFTINGGNLAGALLGYAVGGAGDVDGDVFSDVLIGWPGVDTGGNDRGYAAAYDGGKEIDAPKFRYNAYARKTGSPYPLIPPFDVSDLTTFQIFVAGARTPFGINDVRLEWEILSYGTAFDGNPDYRATWYAIALGGSGVSGVATLPGVSGDAAHWRARLEYYWPSGMHSPWFYGGIPGQPSTTHLRRP